MRALPNLTFNSRCIHVRVRKWIKHSQNINNRLEKFTKHGYTNMAYGYSFLTFEVYAAQWI
jgi:hypothetical protein